MINISDKFILNFIFVLEMDESLDISAIEEDTFHACKDCTYSTKDKSNFNKHVKRHQRPKTSTPKQCKDTQVNSSNMQICEYCGRRFSTRFGLSLHRKNKHTLEFKHVCTICGKGFNQSLQFKYHVSNHVDVPLEKCQYCRVEMKAPGSLARHLEICRGKPLGSTTFNCGVCGVSFPRKYKLQEHIRGKHEKTLRYRCSCGKRYNWRSSLKAHQKACPNTA